MKKGYLEFIGTLLIILSFPLGIAILLVDESNQLLEQQTNLEIYLQDDIMYVNHLTVTFESDSKTISFKDKESLKQYVAEITANNVN